MKQQISQISFVIITIILLFIIDPTAIKANPNDFDGNNISDLAVGVPYENVGSTTDAGSVTVIYGVTGGLSGNGNEYWQQNYLDGSNAENFDDFGESLVVGDFDGDEIYDLAVGVPYEDVGSVGQAGAVNIIYGSSSGGLDSDGNQYWNQDEPGIRGACEAGDHFGHALAAGDFNGDGYDDLAIGVPEEDIDSLVDAGAVQVLYGTTDGLSADGDEFWNDEGAAEAGDLYGSALAAGDFNMDGYDDLAIGIPSEDLGSIGNAGAVEILYGSGTGLKQRVVNDFWHQGRSGVADTEDANDFFGSSLSTGDFNGDGYSDLAVGVPFEDQSGHADAGAVNVFYGSTTGITSDGCDFWHQDVETIHSLIEADDRFGFALTSGDFDGDGHDDLAVGVPYEHWLDTDTGIVQVLYGTAEGLTDIDNQLWRQDIAGIEGSEEADDRFGYALAAGDFNGDGYHDLAVGVPYEAIDSTDQAGAVNVIYGSENKLTADGDQIWYQGYEGLQGTPELGDRFGYALAAIVHPKDEISIYLPLVLNE
jgi:hypothetical protein